ncbi:hypothetical protein PAXINDRAFT_15990 [Paxillus involutus ATCC 200175]|uniref:Unplaced genomic scaffold PAXINscaffold_65, whole genome shotgun sequence n=1 Tax=Paxillus involutus ATCC 200175 TaxID=664439 RepID=A0A0C9TK77_PAXIN|nr:hypothetical protein PAXINDRAFT_15990 [Paxillus involutus ATCC 200175]
MTPYCPSVNGRRAQRVGGKPSNDEPLSVAFVLELDCNTVVVSRPSRCEAEPRSADAMIRLWGIQLFIETLNTQCLDDIAQAHHLSAWASGKIIPS